MANWIESFAKKERIAASLFDLLDLGITIGFNKGGIVARTKSKFKGHF